MHMHLEKKKKTCVNKALCSRNHNLMSKSTLRASMNNFSTVLHGPNVLPMNTTHNSQYGNGAIQY